MKKWPLFLILLGSAIFFLVRLNRDLLWDWDECIYAQYATEMTTSGSFWVNVWNGSRDLFQPPLYAWLLQIPLMFGNSEFHFRILSVIGSLALIAAVYLYSNRYFSGKTAVLASLFLLTTGLLVLNTIRANTEIFQTLFVFLSLYLWTASNKSPRLSYISGGCLGLAVLTEGAESVIYVLAFLASVFVSFRKEKLNRFFKLVITFLAIVLPWYIFVLQRFGWESLSNYFYRTEAYASPFIYIRQIYRDFSPWILMGFVFPAFALLGDRTAFRFIVKEDFRDADVWPDILLLILIPLLCIMIMNQGVGRYALPIYPFFAIYLAANAIFLLEKLELQKAYFLFLIPVLLQGTQLLSKSASIREAKREIPPRYEVILAASHLPQPELEYLVSPDERQIGKMMDPGQNSRIWIFGGNPCSVFYSRKKVHFYYFPDAFVKRIQKSSGLFLIQNEDWNIVEKSPVKIIFQNRNYTLFQR